MKILRRVQTLLGQDAIVDTHPDGLPLVRPRTTEECAVLLEAASAEGWKVRIEGARTWSPPNPHADLALSTTGLNRVVAVHAADLVATVECGAAWESLRQVLADQGAWIAADPPGSGRTLGSIVATGTSGPLRAGFGGLRDHLLGLTLVTGDGRILKPGGQVVKNVAGFDLTRLAAGSFGLLGVITSMHLRLRTVPRADATLLLAGERDNLVETGIRILDAGEAPAAMELISPAAARRETWVLAVRLLGSEPAVEEARRSVATAAGVLLDDPGPVDAPAFWREVASGASGHPTTLRVGALPSSLADALDLVTHHLDGIWLTANIALGSIRWCGSTNAERIKLLRHAALQYEFPVTLERAPWDVMEAAGHYGLYREGVARLVASIRRSFDPQQALVSAPRDPE
ncbi:MAG: FAD-binding oxidoreductase [Gemmatimonadetes bacterium]|nr:FAD-binding oxidoreductase [Gemmatimonadota bacterium]